MTSTGLQTPRPSDDTTIVTRTQLIDIGRSVPLALIFTLESSVLLAIAILHFDAPGWAKGMIAASGGVGLLLSTIVTAGARRAAVPAMRVAAIVVGTGAIGFLAASTGSLVLFVIGGMVGLASVSINLPLLTATYDRNFPAGERGRRVSRGLTAKTGAAAVIAVGIGTWLERRPQDWWLIVLIGAAAAGTLSVLNASMPSEPLPQIERRGVLPHFHLLRDDPPFAKILASWMFLGFGNLMLLPLRVEYLAQPKYGIAASAALITTLTITVPSLVRLCAIPLFGRVFDRLPFFTLRTGVNVLFIVSAAVFFASTTTVGLWAGSMLFGLAFAGGELLWMLWVTKFAPDGQVADYMGLHMFFTGVRALAAPLVGYLIVEQLALGWVAVLGGVLMVIGTLMLAPQLANELRGRTGRGGTDGGRST